MLWFYDIWAAVKCAKLLPLFHTCHGQNKHALWTSYKEMSTQWCQPTYSEA